MQAHPAWERRSDLLHLADGKLKDKDKIKTKIRYRVFRAKNEHEKSTNISNVSSILIIHRCVDYRSAVRPSFTILHPIKNVKMELWVIDP